MSPLSDRSLDEKNEDRINNLMALFERLNDRPDHTAEVELLMQRVTQLEAEVEELREMVQNQSKAGKIEKIEQAALNKADPTMTGVVMTYKEIMAATGVSHTQAYRYIEELPREYDRFSSREDEEKTRAVIVDLSHVRTKQSD